ncbi:MAG: hypothetical protein Q4F75_05690 [Pseudomonadota bacterium]|nr:hypothetical protein [Pseudomonadota bacterium]
MMKINFLLLGTSLSLIPNLINAQCVATTDCATLGYTEKSCPDGKGLKCPFGTTFACPASDKSVCEKYGFKYTCTGTGYAGGVGQSCNKQYESCTCTSGYEWKDGKCEKEKLKPILGQCTGYAKNCSIGQILNSDGTCSNDKVSGKTPIGVVVYISGGSDKCGYAMTASPIGNYMQWSTEYVTTGAFLSYNWQNAIKDFDVSGNMTKIIQAGNASTYPAAYAALNYAPSAAPTSKGKWMLPTAGILNSLYMNLNAINNTISKLGGTQLTGDKEHIWSSSEYANYYDAWVFCTGSNHGARQGGVDYYNKASDGSSFVVRPVIAF